MLKYRGAHLFLEICFVIHYMALELLKCALKINWQWFNENLNGQSKQETCKITYDRNIELKHHINQSSA